MIELIDVEKVYAGAVGVICKLVGHARAKHPVDPALDDSGRHAPPIRVNHDDAVGELELAAVLLD